MARFKRIATPAQQFFFWCTVTLLLSGTDANWGAENKGYLLTSEGVVVNQAEQWKQWTHPTHAAAIDLAEHTVSLRRIRKSTNAIEDISRFQMLIGDQGAYDSRRAELERENILNVRTAPARIAGIPVFHTRDDARRGTKAGDPIIWYYFHGGIRKAPTNPALAPHILDGDLTTYWEPSSVVSQAEYEALPPVKKGPVYYYVTKAGQEQRVDREEYEQAAAHQRRIQYNSRALDNWYLDIDLGRLVPVSRIALHFVEPEMGEPFRQFRILGTPSHRLDAPLSLIARTHTPNVDQRLVEFNLDELDEDKYIQLHRLRIAITESLFEKFQVVSEEEFYQLPIEKQGDVEYYIVNAVGTETRVDREIYEQAGPERQGRRVYYQRERPRLARLEVWSQGDNIALDIIDGGGSVELTGPFPATPGFDGLYTTDFRQLVWSPDPRYHDRGILTLDMGAVFWVDQLRMVSNVSGADQIAIWASEGKRDSRGELEWVEIDRQQGQGVPLETKLEQLVPARFIKTQIFSDTPGRAGGYMTGNLISEFQIFGEGYPAEVVLISPMIELSSSIMLGNIEWELDSPDAELAEVEIRTRTGDQLVEITEYYGVGGESMTRAEHDRLPAFLKGPTVTRMVPGGGWSSWSQKYLQSGDRITSPSPKQFLQIQAKLLSKTPDIAPTLRSLRVGFLPLVARQALAKIWPNEVPMPGLHDLELYLQPTFTEQQPGGAPSSRFDQILVEVLPNQDLELLDISMGTEQDFDHGTAQNFNQVGWQEDPITRQITSWFTDPSGERFQTLIDPISGDTLKVLQGQIADTDSPTQTPRLMVRLPRKVALLPPGDEQRTYHRIILEEEEEVPVDEIGRPLNLLTYLNLPREQQGRITYFKLVGVRPDGSAIQEAVSELEYEDLADSLKGEVRYFRKLIGIGGEFPFDQDGNRLGEPEYNALPVAARGAITAGGELIRMRFKAKVMLNGTTIDVAIRDSNLPHGWQKVAPGDATSLRPGATLSISMPFSSRIIQNLTVNSNPFTPNADGINDQTEIRFNLGNLNTGREIQVKIFDLSGRRIWTARRSGFGEQIFVWDGTYEAGGQVPPGMYVCKVEVDVDAKSASHTTAYQLIAVVY